MVRNFGAAVDANHALRLLQFEGVFSIIWGTTMQSAMTRAEIWWNRLWEIHMMQSINSSIQLFDQTQSNNPAEKKSYIV